MKQTGVKSQDTCAGYIVTAHFAGGRNKAHGSRQSKVLPCCFKVPFWNSSQKRILQIPKYRAWSHKGERVEDRSLT